MSSPSLSRRDALSLLALLTAPTLTSGCKQQKPLPEYGDIGQFTLKDHTGKPFSRANLDGQVWVVNFFFTRCPTVCPKLTQKMRDVQVASEKASAGLRFLSISVDPDNDTPENLVSYAKKFSVNLSTWTFLTGDYEVVKKTAVSGFKQALDGKAQEDKDHFGIIHGTRLILVDKRGQLRGFYSSKDADVVERLVSEGGSLVG